MESETKIERKYLPVLITALVMLFVVALVGGGIWYYMNQQAKKTAEDNKKQTEELQKQITDLKKTTNATTNSSTTSTTDPYADWKTYTSAKYGLSLKYPASWTVNDTNPTVTNDVPAPNPSIIFKDAAGNDFRVYAYPKDLGAGWGMESVKIAIGYTGIVTNKKITLSARTFRENTDTQVNGGTKGYWIHSNLIYGSTDYRFNGTGSDATKYNSGDDIFNKIVNSITLN